MRSLVHCDGDRFFASIEQAADQRLRNRPIAIGAARRGIVISASNEARPFGVRPGMPVRRAKRACPSLLVLPGHFDLYEQFFQQILSLCEQTTPLVQPVAIGAAYLDLTGTRAIHGKGALPVVRQLRQTIQRWLRVSFSTGIGANKTVARIASRFRKPAGELVVLPGHEASFLSPFPVGCLEGIRPEARGALELAGVRTLGALASAPLDALQLVLGRQALQWQRRAQGVDEDPVRPQSANAPQWRETVEFAGEAWEEPLILASLKTTLERLMTRVRERGIEVRRLTLSLRYTDREETTHALTLDAPSCLESDFEPVLPGLLRSAWKRRVRLRSLSLTVSRIYRPSPQLPLFDSLSGEHASSRALAAAVDRIRRKYGKNAIHRGAPAESPPKE
ncbi:MAG: DNA polymerase IV [Bryobacterales bacterium]|nr:DNA polymerase IV [Bryobacterales bacterium]